jgi:hypothetical protein
MRFSPGVEAGLLGGGAGGMASTHSKVAVHRHEKTKSEEEKKTDPRTFFVEPCNIQGE